MDKELMGMVLGGLFFILGAAVIIVVTIQAFTTIRARAAIARESVYKELAEDVSLGLRGVVEFQQRQEKVLTDIQNRLTVIEKTLTQLD